MLETGLSHLNHHCILSFIVKTSLSLPSHRHFQCHCHSKFTVMVIAIASPSSRLSSLYLIVIFSKKVIVKGIVIVIAIVIAIASSCPMLLFHYSLVIASNCPFHLYCCGGQRHFHFYFHSHHHSKGQYHCHRYRQ